LLPSKPLHARAAAAEDAFLSGVDVLPFDNAAAERFGSIVAALSSDGEAIDRITALCGRNGGWRKAISERRQSYFANLATDSRFLGLLGDYAAT
jgi:hypothetical protein